MKLTKKQIKVIMEALQIVSKLQKHFWVDGRKNPDEFEKVYKELEAMAFVRDNEIEL